MVSRRTHLAALWSGSVLTGGCLVDGSEEPSVLTDDQPTITARGGGERQHAASLSCDTATDRFHVEETYAKTEVCGPFVVGQQAAGETMDVETRPVNRADWPSCHRESN